LKKYDTEEEFILREYNVLDIAGMEIRKKYQRKIL